MSPLSQLKLGFSPCPNDTFIFHALVHGLIPSPEDCRLTVELRDVEALNRLAADEHFDVTKLSVYAWLKHQARYRLLDSGAALGFGCGPLVVARPGFDIDRLPRGRIALPGRDTTAHLLFQLWSPEIRDKYFVSYDRIFEHLLEGQADAGVIIHENRFTYDKLGLKLVVDLGAWWERETGLPIPLGVIAAHACIPSGFRQSMDAAIRDSIAHARRYPHESLAYMREHAQEMAEEVLRQHVATYVNGFSLTLGNTGRQAIQRLASMARARGVLA